MKRQICLGLKNMQKHILNYFSKEKTPTVKIISEEQNRTQILITCGDDDAKFDAMIQWLSDFIIQQYEQKLLVRMLQLRYNHLKLTTVYHILEYFSLYQNDITIGYAARKNAVSTGLKRYFFEHDCANLEGLVTFRLQEYETVLHRASEYLYEHFLTQKEYHEFISLLRYFVSVQVNRPKVFHIMCVKNGMYAIFDENFFDITSACIEEFIPAEEVNSSNFDDLLISILITAAPKEVVLHNRVAMKNEELYHTMQAVFESVSECSNCDLCKSNSSKE